MTIKTKPATADYRDGYDRIFSKKPVECPKCRASWSGPCQQTKCIDLHGECIRCRFVPVGPINVYGSGCGLNGD